MRANSALAVTAGVTALSVLGLVATAVVGRPVPSALEPAQEAVFVPVESWPDDQARTARMSVVVRPPVEVLSSGAPGLVTRVWVEAGDTLTGGQRVYAADGVPVFAYRGSGVLFRPLKQGDRGEDVRVLQRALGQVLDEDLPDSGQFGTATREAVRRLQGRMGVTRTGEAQPAWFVRVPARAVVGDLSVRVGAVAPAAGELVLTTRAALARLEVNVDGPADGEYVFVANGVPVPLELADGEWSTASEATVLALAPITSAQGGEGAGTGSDTGTGAGEGTEQRASTKDATAWIDGVLALPEPSAGAAVAPAALVRSQSGDTACVWRQTETGAERIDGVTITGTTPSGAAIVSGEELAGAQVLVDPARFLSAEDARCP